MKDIFLIQIHRFSTVRIISNRPIKIVLVYEEHRFEQYKKNQINAIQRQNLM